MRALVAAGTRQEPRQQNGSDKPRECRHLECGASAAHRKIDRECRECRETSEQPRVMVKTVTAPALRLVRRTDAPERPLIVAPPCQSEIKRTLRRARRQSKTGV